MDDLETKLLYLGRNPKKHNRCVNTPIYKSSTFIFETIEEFLQEDAPFHTDTTYGRSGTPTIHELENSITMLEGADQTFLTPSGRHAVVLALLSFLQTGDHVLIPDASYKCTKRFVEEELVRMGIGYTYYRSNIADDIKGLIKPNTKVLFLESPGSATFETQDIPLLTSIAKTHNLTTILDNTWATPLYFQGMEHGVDVIIQSLSKYFSGHADLIMGSISFKNKHNDPIRTRFRNYGSIASPEDAYLVLRGMRTMGLRIKQHGASALKVAEWLEKQPYVLKVMYPALPSSETYKIWKRDYKGATGVFGVILKRTNKDTLYKCLNMLKYFSIGLSWGGFESLIVPYDLHLAPEASKHIPDGNCLRLNIGLESVDILIDDLDESLKNLEL
jgi:cystathionine beta-lyase